MFVSIGRLACETHYAVSRAKITTWLDECGKADLIARRAAHLNAIGRSVRRCPADFDVAYVSLGPEGCERRYSTSNRTIRRWLDERGRERLQSLRAAETRTTKLTREDMTAILSKAFPVPLDIDPALVRHAAQFLRIRRNGGWVISPANDDLWWVGSRRRTAAELLDLAVNAGFDPANLRGEPHLGLRCARP